MSEENPLQVSSRADAMNHFQKLTEELAPKGEEKPIEEVVVIDEKPKGEEVVVVEGKEVVIEGEEKPAKEVVKTFEEILAEEEEIKQAEQKKKDFESLYEDELAKTILEAKRQGKDIRQVLKALSETDPNDFTEIELFALSLRGELNEDGQPLTQEDIEDKYNQFKEMPQSIQKKIIEGQKTELENKFKETTKLLSEKTDNPYIESAKKANEDLLVALKEMVGTNFHGVEVTNKIAAELYKEASMQLRTTNQDKNFDVSAAMDKAKAILFMPYIVNDAKNIGKTEGKLEVLNKVHSPSASGKPVVTKAQTTESPEERSLSDFGKYVKNRKNPFQVAQTN